jgi:septum site-determining protein MinD
LSKIIAIHSFRGGTGKSNLTANLAAIMTAHGHRVGIIDTDIASPGVHVLFNVDQSKLNCTLNDYLWGNCEIEQAAVDVTAELGTNLPERAKLLLIPASIDTSEIAKVLHTGYDVGMLNDGIMRLIEECNLDYLFVDTHPGVNEETLLSIAIADVTLIVLRPDQQDFQGTAVTVELARQLDVKHLLLVVNKAHKATDLDGLKKKVEDSLQAEVVQVITLNENMVQLGSKGLFCIQFPNESYSKDLAKIAGRLLSVSSVA